MTFESPPNFQPSLRGGGSGGARAIPLLRIGVQIESDVVVARQRARQIAAHLGFDVLQQTKLATAVSEIARNAFTYGGGGRVEFSIEGHAAPQLLVIRVTDSGPGIADLPAILEGRYRSTTGMGVGISGARRLMDWFEIASTPGRGVTVCMTRLLPLRAPLVTPRTLGRLLDELGDPQPEDALGEMRQQNRELLATLTELAARQEDLVLLNRELEDTNRGVMALYAELDEKAAHLRRADEMKSRFLSHMSHEFRTPLNSILALTRLLLDRADGELGTDQERQVFFIRKSAESLYELVNDLLDLAKVEAGKITLHPAEFDVKNLFGALRGMLRPLLLDASVKLVFDDPEDVPAIVSDEAKVSQILRNFISNALKFTERGEVRVHARRDRDRVIFSVADTGIGIDRADLDRIFEEFTQIESPIQRHVKGTGLGLPLSRKLAALLGGSVSVESSPAVGSIFSLAIPLVYAPVSRDDRATAEVQQSARIPILVLEDHFETRLLYENHLAGTKYHMMPARSVSEARRVLDHVRPRAIVLDLVLGTEDSRALLAELKGRDDTKDIPVLVISAVDDPHKVYGLSSAVYTRKPVGKEWLVESLDRHTMPPKGRRVLVVDDDPGFRYLIKQLFAGAHPESIPQFIEAENGVEGLAAARSHHPELIFLDLMMPRMNGFEMLEQLRSAQETQGIPVIVCSSRALTGSERTQLETCAARFLSKDRFADDDVIAATREILAAVGLGDLLPDAIRPKSP